MLNDTKYVKKNMWDFISLRGMLFLKYMEMANNLKAKIVPNNENFLRSDLKYLILEELIKPSQAGRGNL